MKQRMTFTGGLLWPLHNKVSATAEFLRLITFKGKGQADPSVLCRASVNHNTLPRSFFCKSTVLYLCI